MSDVTLHLTEPEWRQVRAALSERRFDRARSITNVTPGHDDCCPKARARASYLAEVNAALQQDVDTCEAVLARLPAYEQRS